MANTGKPLVMKSTNYTTHSVVNVTAVAHVGNQIFKILFKVIIL